jgi:antitoxin (DNA-binding transcriptional repressor) of toxin-antitoxin stability system
MLEEARITGEPIEVLKRGKPLATVLPAPTQIEYRPGKFKDSVRITGDILVDGADLEIQWEAMK